MKRNCKSCKIFKDCDLTKFLPFPQVGCSDFKHENLFLYAVILHNYASGCDSVLNIFDDLNLAHAEQKQLTEDICKRPSSDIVIYIKPYDFSEAKDIADKMLIEIAYVVSFDLSAAERGFKNGSFKKKTFDKSKTWFDLAHVVCRRGAAILDVIYED